MKLFQTTFTVFILAISSMASFAGDHEAMGPGEAMAARDCAWCHGQQGKGFATAPRLAGQTRQYIENQLVSFRAHSRDNPKSEQFMWGAAAQIDAQAAAELAYYFSTLEPAAANDGDQDFVARGQTVYRDGNPEANIPSCIACHGPNAEGIGPMPRLAGLSVRYLRRRLQQWGEGYHLTAMAPMPTIAKNLPPQEIEALASFLSFGK